MFDQSYIAAHWYTWVQFFGLAVMFTMALVGIGHIIGTVVRSYKVAQQRRQDVQRFHRHIEPLPFDPMPDDAADNVVNDDNYRPVP